jgi:hypothetical protein
MHRCQACEEVESFSSYFGRGVNSSSRGKQLHPQLVVVLRVGGEEDRERRERGKRIEREMRERER